ncbi:MAG: prepilin-type N-terminal cleavage/methylation domain-containing protein [Verrucomicrobiota bacterium]
MKWSLKLHFTKSFKAFSLVEMLVAMAVFALLMLVLSQMLGLAKSSLQMGRRRVDALGKGRITLDLIANDLTQGIFRPDLPAFKDKDGSDSSLSGNYAFYTRRAAGDERAVSLVSYRQTQDKAHARLERGALAMKWSYSESQSLHFGVTGLNALGSMDSLGEYQEVFSGVAAFRMFFLNINPKTGKMDFSSHYENKEDEVSRIVGVTIVIMDDATEKAFSDLGKIEMLVQHPAFELPHDLQDGIKKVWDQKMSDPEFSKKIPSPVRLSNGIRCFERFVPISTERPTP